MGEHRLPRVNTEYLGENGEPKMGENGVPRI